MIRDLLEDIFSPYSSFGDRIMAIIMMLVMLAIVVLVVFLIYHIADSTSVKPTKTTVAVIECKYTVSAHTTTSFVPAGKVLIPITNYHPESYYLNFKIEGKEVDPSVDKSYYDIVKTGEKIKVEYGYTRLSRSPIPVSISTL